MKKTILMFLTLSLLVLMFASNSLAVIFASDGIHLFQGWWRIRNNSVIYKPAGERYKRFTVCEKGYCTRRQGVEPNTLIFFKTNDPDVLTQAEWWELNPEDRPGAETYQKYLEQKAQTSIYSKEITIPDTTDNKTYNSPPEGMTGGTIGSGRIFKINLISGKVK